MKVIKNSINNMLAYILMFILIVLLTFIIFEGNISKNGVNKFMNKLNYYDKVHDNIVEKLNDFIILEDLKILYKNYINEDIIKEDINKLLKNIYEDANYKINRHNDFYKIIYEYSNDSEVSEKYAKEINEIYIKNLFPVKPFELISKLYLKNNIQFIIIISLLLLGGLISYSLHLFNNSYKYILISILGASIFIILPNIFIRIFKIFNNFLYSNNYFTALILRIIYSILNTLTIVGICLIIIIFILWIVKKFKVSKKS